MSHPLLASLVPTLLSKTTAEQLLQTDSLSTEQLLCRVSQLSECPLPHIAEVLALNHQLSYLSTPWQQCHVAKVMAIIKELHLEHWVVEHPILPISLQHQPQQLQLVSYDPSLKSVALELQFHHNLTTQLMLTDLEQFQSFYQQILNLLRSESLTTNALNLLPEIMQQSLQSEASDIHIEAERDSARVRMRCDGLLVTLLTISLAEVKALISQIKINADLDIAEQRLPQDGRMKYPVSDDKEIELRVSTLPTLWGEKMVMRLAKEQQALPQLSELGLQQAQLHCLRQALHQPQGLILVTGPTGSGKTITLYSCLNQLTCDTINICTVEDPVEIHLPGLNQIQINAGIGLSFAKSLRALLRQDPDVIMLGEIRDKETAQMAIQAAQTGHLVLSTLHTNSAFDALERLYQLGIEQTDLQSSLRLVLAQRLLRKTCPHCQQQPIKQACYQCHNGYKGRVGVFELLPVNRDLLHQAKQPTYSRQQIQDFLIDKHDLRLAASSLLQNKITTLDEVQRVLGYE
ncbi:GspE/PulE family protein [Vibrio rarus]|uniref:GspE/PulE family protein n=1 Tax=Vibrio rarus TaxID=413403 RepID=UPI0021C2A6D2|nr:GspE/PulE family protein [Vibrio rarus]